MQALRIERARQCNQLEQFRSVWSLEALGLFSTSPWKSSIASYIATIKQCAHIQSFIVLVLFITSLVLPPCLSSIHQSSRLLFPSALVQSDLITPTRFFPLQLLSAVVSSTRLLPPSRLSSRWPLHTPPR